MLDDNDPPEWESWMAGPEAQMYGEHAEADARWSAFCASRIDALWASLPPIVYPDTALYQVLNPWVIQRRYGLKRWK